MAEIDIRERSEFSFRASKMPSWWAFKTAFDYNEERDLSDDVVYLIRTRRPYTIRYKKGCSSTIYIGIGNFKNRISSHLSSWIYPFSEYFTDMDVEIVAIEPRVRNNYYAFKEVEGDFISFFEDRYRELPSGNIRRERDSNGKHLYIGDFGSALGMGRGPGYRQDIHADWLRGFIRERKR
jgi:hypothetical protein